jgi:DNA-binding NarL/FixJ family response regulator
MPGDKRRTVGDLDPAPPLDVKRVLIVDDHELLRVGLRLLINTQQDLKVCAEAADEAEGRKLFRQLHPHVVVVDLKLREGNGLDLIRLIKKQRPATQVLVCSMHDEKVYGERVLRAGASGYVNKQSAASNIVQAIRDVLNGKLIFGEDVIRRVMQRARAEHGAVEVSPIDTLSDRELEVFRLLGQGLPTRQIARILHLSSSTVDTYRERLKTKLGFENGTELIHHATEWVLENE